MYRTLIGICSVFLAALLIVGLTFSATRDEAADFRFLNNSELKSLDPQLTTGSPESRITDAVFEGLARFDQKTLGPVPGAAHAWDLSADGTEYTFHLRKNARWTDGAPVTAHDFTRSWQRLLRPETAAEYAYMLFPIRHAEAFNTADAHATAIEKQILPALARLRAATPGRADASQWLRFVRENKLNDALRAFDAPLVIELLGRQQGGVSASELAELEPLLVRRAAELRHEAREARAHFGKDRGAVALDDFTLRVELRAPTPHFIELMSHHSAFPVPRAVAEAKRAPNDWYLPGNIVSNGPFRVKRWVVNDHLRLERNETYWGKDEVRLSRIDVLPNDNWTTSVNLYLTGAVDWLPRAIPAELAPALRKRADFYAEPGLSLYFFRLNTTKKPLDDRRVRKALNLAVDRKLIVTSVRELGELPATTIVPPGLDGYTPSETAIRFDVAEARRLLAEAGYPDGKGFPKVGLLFNTSEDHRKIADAIADQLRKNLGIEVGPYNQEWQSYLGTSRAMDYEMARGGWIGDYLDPNTFLDMWLTNGENNFTGFSSPLYDRLIRLAADVTPFIADPEPLLEKLRDPAAIRRELGAARSANAAERLAASARIRFLLFREAEAILVNDEFPIIPMFFYVDIGLLRRHVKGFAMRTTLPNGKVVINLQDRHPLRDLWIEGREEGRP
jgi:oligopeptide transport system substrate-binding protein